MRAKKSIVNNLVFDKLASLYHMYENFHYDRAVDLAGLNELIELWEVSIIRKGNEIKFNEGILLSLIDIMGLLTIDGLRTENHDTFINFLNELKECQGSVKCEEIVVRENSIFKLILIGDEYKIIRKGDNRTREIWKNLDKIIELWELSYSKGID